MSWAWAALAAVLVAWTAALWPWRRLLARLWREPVLRVPVVVLESDDWGAAAVSDAEALARLAAVLVNHRDVTGRPAVMTLGVVLAAPDGRAWRRAGPDALAREFWPRRRLDEPDFRGILEAMESGVARGVFALQLHGLDHCWPASVRAAARADARIAQWLVSSPLPEVGRLPAHLQTRWSDCAVLPSRPLPEEAVEEAVQSETAAWREIFGTPARVAVPPTFVWTRAVERAWASRGVRCVVTPGRRHEGRDGRGEPAPGPRLLNGERGGGGILYLVRDVYFEPARGHDPEAALEAVLARVRQGRPALIETHRENYVGAHAEASRAALETLLVAVRETLPGVRFVDSLTLAMAFAGGAAGRELLARDQRTRVAAWAARVRALPGARRRLRWSGLDPLLAAVARLGPRHVRRARPASATPRPAGGAA